MAEESSLLLPCSRQATAVGQQGKLHGGGPWGLVQRIQAGVCRFPFPGRFDAPRGSRASVSLTPSTTCEVVAFSVCQVFPPTRSTTPSPPRPVLALFAGFPRPVAPEAVVFFTLLFEAFFRAPDFFLDDWVFACERFLVALRLPDFFAAAMAVSRLALGLRAECRKLG